MTRRVSPLLLLLAVLAAVLAFAAHTTSASAAGFAETRVGASDQISAARTGVASEVFSTATTGNTRCYDETSVGDLFATDATVEVGGSGAPNFIVHPNGNVIPVPDGAVGPFPANNGAGIKFTGGSGGNGLDPSVSGARIMDPNARNPGGYYSYFNDGNQAVDPYTGTTLGRSDPGWHRQW